MNFTKLLLLTITALSTTFAMAQYTGPNATPVHRSVSDVLKSAKDDDQVELEGYVIKKLSKEKYIFSDGKTEIRIELDDKHLPNVKFDEKTKVQIKGEVERDNHQSPEIDVTLVTILE
jgi:uncharacterized protein (TIGR00156 family)